MRLLVDMNLTPRWVDFLGNAAHSAVHCSSVGSGSAKDSEICEYARQHAFAILTNDLDFPQILAHIRQAGPSVVLLRGEPLVPETRGPALLRALQDCEAELNQGAIVTLDWSDKPRAINAVHLMMFRWGGRSFCVVCQRSPKAADHEVRWSAPPK